MNFLYWNIKGNQVSNFVSTAAIEHDIDFIVLSEAYGGVDDILKALNRTFPNTPFRRAFSSRFDPILLTRHPLDRLSTTDIGPHISFYGIDTIIGPEIILATAHLPSKLHYGPPDQFATAIEAATEIRDYEDTVGHSRTVLLGDLNMDPFEDGVVTTTGFHAIPCRKIASRRTRVVKGVEYPFFYNPMWNLLGDSTWPPGTYYRTSSTPRCFFWNMFDQVLLRPDILPMFDNATLRILTSTGEGPLATPTGHPHPTDASDHFPITFTLDVMKGHGDD